MRGKEHRQARPESPGEATGPWPSDRVSWAWGRVGMQCEGHPGVSRAGSWGPTWRKGTGGFNDRNLGGMGVRATLDGTGWKASLWSGGVSMHTVNHSC